MDFGFQKPVSRIQNRSCAGGVDQVEVGTAARLMPRRTPSRSCYDLPVRLLLPWLSLLACVPALQDSHPEINRAIRSLSDASREVRQKAEAALLALGTKALPALKKALDDEDIQIRDGVKPLIFEIERPERERVHDAANRKKIINPKDREGDDDLSRRIREMYPLSIEGASYRNDASSFKGGLVIRTSLLRDLFFKFEFDIASATTKEGKPLAIERCGKCSPELVYVRDPGPIQVKISMIRSWFSEYEVEFTNPQDGDVKKVGDFVIAVKWPVLEISCTRGYPQEILDQACKEFKFRLKNPPPAYDTMGVGAGGGGGGRYGGRFGGKKEKKWWCTCEDGPQPVTKSEIKLITSWKVESRHKLVVPSTVDPAKPDPEFPAKVDEVASITLQFRKPVEEAFEIDRPDLTASGSLDTPKK